jgi:7,8-dihydropterin-6-yl-methyl-4-(beta-D-ribofuranosyl)aminobenzene 5'-phosphate synthase
MKTDLGLDQAEGAARITLLVDNKAGVGLRSEHGFSAWVEVGGRRLLFDTGQGPSVSSNAAKLGIDLRTADILVLSHGHYDHTGGIPAAIEHAPAIQVYLHPAATCARYSIREGTARSIAMPWSAKAALDVIHDGGTHWITAPVEIESGVGLTGPIPRLTDYEDTGGPFYTDAEGAHGDPITDDQALWIRTNCGLVVVVGCSHAGLINTLRYTQQLSGEARVCAVVGGFHLTEAVGSRLECTVAALRELDPNLIVPCHCTGDAAVERLRRTLGERVSPGFAGASYIFGSGQKKPQEQQRKPGS